MFGHSEELTKMAKGLLGLPKGGGLESTLPMRNREFMAPRTLPITDPDLWLDAQDVSTITIATGVSA
jgi:hypothetical protein